MKKHLFPQLIFAFISLMLTPKFVAAQKTSLERIHENVRVTPYPQQGHTLYLNPSPLIVPAEMRKAEFLQFELSQDIGFASDKTIQSKPLPWCFFNPHRVLEEGKWYWRFRSVETTGDALPWSETHTFVVSKEIPQFVTPGFETFYSNLPKGFPRIYCFMEKELATTPGHVKTNPEYKEIINRGKIGLDNDFENDANPLNVAGQMGQMCNYLYTAYRTTGDKVYADKMLSYTRALISTPFTPKKADDFYCGDVLYLLTHTYDACYDLLGEDEKEKIGKLIFEIVPLHHDVQRKGKVENHIFENHYWQRAFREMLQIGLLFAETNDKAKEMLEYCYELWTARAPASGFNHDGEWHNGQGYFDTNIKTLWYVPQLFSYMTGTDFLQHPFYRNLGKAMVYTWPPRSMSAGFGDGNERQKVPTRQRAALADFLARETGDPYAVWYARECNNFYSDFEMRMYRVANYKKTYPASPPLPADATPAIWLEDTGEMMAHSDIRRYRENLFLSFRSSPFGSGSHTLSDQNSFNLHFRGVPVYRSSGYYLNFSDAHNIMSYRHTRAHNTILVDGIGQPFTTRAYGKMVRVLNGKNISYALGDASNAYCGVSEYPMWEKNFEAANLEQSVENGFGETPLKTYRRHIFLLHPDVVLIFDELEADKPVRWDWLLHSPVKFTINDKQNILTTRNDEKKFASVAQLFSNSACTITQTDKFVVGPDLSKARSGTQYPNQWHMTATFEPTAKNRIMTIIQIQPDGKATKKLTREGNNFRLGSWAINVELDPDKEPHLHIRNAKTGVIFNYGNKVLNVEGMEYQREKGSSVLYDEIDGEWVIHEMPDYDPKATGAVTEK